MYRFEADDSATGLIYNPNETGSARWLDESVTLIGALFGFSSVMASALTVATYLMMM